MKLLGEWRVILNRVWTVRAAIYGALLACADQLLAPFMGHLPPVVYALLYAVIILLRVWQQAPAPNAAPADPEATHPG